MEFSSRVLQSFYLCESSEASAQRLTQSTTPEEDISTRTVEMVFGEDKMTIWMPLVQQPASSPLLVPQHIFRGFSKTKWKANSLRQPEIFYSHLLDADSEIRGPLRYSEPGRRSQWNYHNGSPLLTIEVVLLDEGAWGSGRTIRYHVGGSVGVGPH